MKTPDETKRGLRVCHSVGRVLAKELWCEKQCPYMDETYGCGQDYLHDDALAYIQQLEAANAELLNLCKQLEAKCHQLERERDAAVECIGRLMVNLKTYPYAATNGCAYQAYCEIQKYVENMRGVKEE